MFKPPKVNLVAIHPPFTIPRFGNLRQRVNDVGIFILYQLGSSIDGAINNSLVCRAVIREANALEIGNDDT